MLRARVITALILLPIALLLVLAGGWLLRAVAILLAILMVTEFYSFALPTSKEHRMFFATVSLIPLLGYLINSLAGLGMGLVLATIIGSSVLVLIYEQQTHEQDLRHLLLGLFLGIFYVGLLGSGIFIAIDLIVPRQLLSLGNLTLSQTQASELIPSLKILWFVAVITTTDTMAYFVGRFFGQHALSPRVSPKKTWEGALGGTFAALCLALLLGSLFHIGQSLPYLAFSGLVISVIAQLSDLGESLIKRAFNVKDSGNLLPGHGGILDRLDGYLFSAPVFALLFS